MAVKNRPGSAKETIAQQTAGFRRGAPGGKQFIGGTHDQSARARRDEVKRVERMAEIASARRRA